MNKNITMEEIAAQMGLSRVTVSSIINNKAKQRGVSPKTEKRVKEYLQKCGYTPSRQAVALRTGQRNSVGILHCGHLYSHLTGAFNALCNHISGQKGGLEIMVVRREDFLKGAQELISRGVETLIWIQTSDAKKEFGIDSNIFELLSRVKTIIYNYHYDDEDMDKTLLNTNIYTVGISRKQAFKTLLNELKRKKKKRILRPDCFFTHPNEDPLAKVLNNGSLEVHSMPSPELRATTDPKIIRKISKAIIKIIKQQNIDTICFRDDEVAGYYLSELQRCSFKIPDQLSITGFDGLDIVNSFYPRLTTLQMPMEDMLNKTLALTKSKPSKKQYCFKAKLLKGDSLA